MSVICMYLTLYKQTSYSCLSPLHLPPPLPLYKKRVATLTSHLETSTLHSEQLNAQLNQVRAQVKEGNYKIINFDQLTR